MLSSSKIFSSQKIKISLMVFLCISFCYLVFGQINSRPFERWDEQINVEVVTQSLNSENPLLLKLNDANFFEKPPIWYYATEVAVSIFGVNNFSFRIVSALSAMCMSIMIFIILKKLAGFYPAIIGCLVFLAIPQLYFINVNGYFSSHILSSADLDSLQIMLIFFSFFILFYKKISNTTICLSFLALGLGFLTKGPMVFVPLIINIFYLVNLKIKLKKIFFGFMFFTVPIVLWLLYMVFNYGANFINEFLGYHLLSRATQALEGHNGSIFFYWKIFIDPLANPFGLVSLFILAIFIIKTVRAIITKPQKKLKNPSKEALVSRAFIYSNIFIISFLLIITAINTKLAWYILPVYPFVAIQIGLLFRKISK